MRSRRKRGVNPRLDIFDDVWKQFSLYVRRRDNWTCITCGKKERGGSMHGGHFIHGKGKQIYFTEDNVHAQCGQCNFFRSDMKHIYTLKMIDRYGRERTDELVESEKADYYWGVKELKGLLEKYKGLNKEMDKELR